MPSDMTVTQFAEIVRDMRQTQKTFFRTRDYTLVERAKQLERKVDELVEQVLEKQPKLF